MSACFIRSRFDSSFSLISLYRNQNDPPDSNSPSDEEIVAMETTINESPAESESDSEEPPGCSHVEAACQSFPTAKDDMPDVG